MAIYVFWFLLALVLLGLEMATGTFYLLMLSLAMAVGGAAALLGCGPPAQLALAALAGVAGIVLLRRWKGGRSRDAASQSLDTGQVVKVLTWHDDGTARVYYRGAEWDAELDANVTAHGGYLYIKDIRGSVLVLTDHKAV
ncbi:MAG TPA: NfeD family protein [Gallionellaceae bacterium]|nr:NfeD family protein [Gallionellaceae bacterium]